MIRRPALQSISLFLSACCIAFAALPVSASYAQEFKPFLTIQTAGPAALAQVFENIGGLVHPNAAAELQAQLTPLKNIQGITPDTPIGLALQINDESPLFGLDAILVLPIANLAAFNIPGMEQELMMFKMMMGQPTGGRHTIVSPVGNLFAYPKQGFFVVATEGAAEFAASADPKTLFAEIETAQSHATFGITVNLNNVTLDDVKMVLEQVAPMLAMSGIETDPLEMLSMLETNAEEVLTPSQLRVLSDTDSFTLSLAIDPNTLNTTIATLHSAKPNTQQSIKYQNTKNAQTKFSGFLPDTPKTVFSFLYLDYMTDAEIEDIETSIEMLGEGFVEGILEGAGEGDGSAAAALFASGFLQWLDSVVAHIDNHRLLDAVLSLDSDGIFLYADSIGKELLEELDVMLQAVLRNLGPEGVSLSSFIIGKIESDYETVAGYSLSALPDIFSDLPDIGGIPAAVREISLSAYWAVKDDAAAFAIGPNAEQTESALKAALTASDTPVLPKQIGVIAVKPLGEFLQKHFLPIMVMVGEADIAQARTIFEKLAGADAGARMVITQEFLNDAALNKFRIDGRVFGIVPDFMPGH